MLLIDEAYSLARGGENDFSREAIDTIVKLVEDRRDRLVVILTGYTDEMAALVAANPGMESRFPKTIHFPDYSDDELVRIFAAIGAAGRYTLDSAPRPPAALPRRPGRPGSATVAWPAPVRGGGGQPGDPPRVDR